MTRQRTNRSIGALAAGVLVGTGLIAGAASPASASDSECPPATTAPVLNTWYDAQGKYQGTYLAHREKYFYLHDDIYDTYGPNYRQIEVWERGSIMLPDRRVSCVRKPHTPKVEPETPTVTGSGGGTYVNISFPGFGMSFTLDSSTAKKGRVDVGDIEMVE